MSRDYLIFSHLLFVPRTINGTTPFNSLHPCSGNIPGCYLVTLTLHKYRWDVSDLPTAWPISWYICDFNLITFHEYSIDQWLTYEKTFRDLECKDDGTIPPWFLMRETVPPKTHRLSY